MKFNRSTLGLVTIVCLISSTLAPPSWSQEKIRIDEKTMAIVPSPWKLMEVETTASLRGLYVLSESEVWISGSGGTIINSTDGGETWNVRVVPGAEELDFRDIHAIDSGTIVAMTSGSPARVYRSTNGGATWELCFEKTDEQVFLDALSFWDDQNGIIMGDPIDEKLYLIGTTDGGKTWTLNPNVPRTNPGEAGFAGSGTNMISIGNRKMMVALGGDEKDQSKESSRVLISENRGQSWIVANMPIGRNPSSGVFSVCFANDNDGVAVGGDYLKADDNTNNFATSSDGGKTWVTPQQDRQPPSGYRSCVATWLNGREINFVTVGPTGTDLSGDLGKSWRRVSNQGFHAVDFTQDGKHGWASGGDGRIAKWVGIPNSKSTQR
ncbi:MAG: photosystem II stability/assembly factor-like uncharacterized protein [Mariniblastus sp.]|jgi:photosystem II stability/assembly factor-like uncharacterized protein